MATPINPQDAAKTTPGPSPMPGNKNIEMLAYLYDNTAHDLDKALRSGVVLLSDEKIKNQVRWLGDIAKTLSLVYQIESMRAKPKENSLALPAEKVNAVDPALKKAQSKQFNPNAPQNLGQYPSPGGWRP